MKKTILLLAAIFCLAVYQPKAANVDYQVIPIPERIDIQRGEGFVISKGTKILYTAGNEKMKRNAAFLSEYLKENTGLQLKMKADRKSTV